MYCNGCTNQTRLKTNIMELKGINKYTETKHTQHNNTILAIRIEFKLINKRYGSNPEKNHITVNVVVS